eukprot:CAMPEP_0197024838 /NCGR_PEP_ID=MMETSP1384-20130603/5316_1 /TAXON_ID=29189 /ORGANISM="Ammonia sp." /LENGTH=468 /DNA_ID=CAMNT_0042453293 /DNA_START=85 /DNA_END=1491 /DNA_ORIENTATION=+
MLPKRIMDSSNSSLSRIVIEFESLGLKSKHNVQNYGAVHKTATAGDATHPQHHGKSPIRSVLWNMLNQIIGTGIVGIPFIYKSTGIIGSIIIMLLFGAISVYTFNLLIHCGKKLDVYNYEELLEKSFGFKGYLISSFCIAILNIGGMLTNLIIIGDATIKVTSIWGYHSTFDRQMILLVCSICIVLPLCLFRDLASLEKAGFVKIIAILVIIVVIFLEFFNSLTSEHAIDFAQDITFSTTFSSIPSAIGVLAFSFVCHDSSFLLFNTLSNPTTARFFKLSFSGTFIAIFFTLCLSIPAYLTFGNSVDANILNNYNIFNPLIVSIRIIFVFTMTLTFPGSFFLVRHILYGWYIKLVAHYGHSSDSGNHSFTLFTVQTAPLSHHVMFTVGIFSAVVATSLFIDDVGVVMSVIGSVSSVNLAFVFPSLVYMKLLLKSDKMCVYRIMMRMIVPFCITVAGVMIAVYGVATSF